MKVNYKDINILRDCIFKKSMRRFPYKARGYFFAIPSNFIEPFNLPAEREGKKEKGDKERIP